MGDVLRKIEEIESEMAKTQKNKATSAHLGMLKAKLAKLRRELITPKSQGGSAKEESFEVAKTGDSRIGFVGFPSVGKSTLLSNLAGVYSEVAAYEFTTLTTVPGCIKYKGAKIQLLDLPGIIEGAKDGKGRGRQVIAVARTANLIFIVLDVLKPLGHKQVIEKELEGFGIRFVRHTFLSQKCRLYLLLYLDLIRPLRTSSSREKRKVASTCRPWCHNLSWILILSRQSWRSTEYPMLILLSGFNSFNKLGFLFTNFYSQV